MGREIANRIIAEDILVAPCRPDGNAETFDEETREGMCVCSDSRCLIDRNNFVIQKDPLVLVRPQQVK